MKVTDIYEGGSHQMRHCDSCNMPAALETVLGNPALYSVTKHAIVETRACWGDKESLEYMRKKHEEQGSLAVFEAALRCVRCIGGMTLIIDGRDTGWSVGGDQAVE